MTHTTRSSGRNIVLFLTDDHAQWAAGCYGNSELWTPALDQLARTGAVYENAFTPSPVCSPARASLLTGLMPSQHGIHDYLAEADPEVRRQLWLRDAILPGLLRQHGYTTALSGKWHLGPIQDHAADFDFMFVQSAEIPHHEYLQAPWETPPAISAGGYDRNAIADRAVEFLRHRDRDRPFFLLVGLIGTHSPWEGRPERLVERYRQASFDDIPHDDVTYPFGRLRSESIYETRGDPRETLAQYYASVTELDGHVGRVLDELNTQSVADDTLVVYTSDHGLNMGQHGIWGKGNGTLPYNVVDESIRVPLIVNHPHCVIRGQRRHELVSHVDTFATILDYAGITPPDHTGTTYPGESYAPSFLSEPLDARDQVFAEYGTLRMVRTRQFKLVRWTDGGAPLLFDLTLDPRETTNLANSPAHRGILQTLGSLLDDHFDRYGVEGRRGDQVHQQPRHNSDEAWRDRSAPVVRATSKWLTDLAAARPDPETASP